MMVESKENVGGHKRGVDMIKIHHIYVWIFLKNK